MSSQPDHRGDPWTAFGLGVFGGVIAGLTLLSFAGLQPLGLAAILGAILVRPRPFGTAGVLLGTGAIWLILFAGAVARCDPSSCQSPDLMPWFAAAFVLMIGGATLLALAVHRRRGQVVGSGTNGPSAVDTATNRGSP
jgi:hypothetical protein